MAVDECKRIALRSLLGRRVCFGGFRRRTWRRYHGLCPWLHKIKDGIFDSLSEGKLQKSTLEGGLLS